MRRLVWSDPALDDLEEVRDHIAVDSAAAAGRVHIRLVEAAASLGDFPNRGRIVRSGVRELATVKPYVIRYAILRAEIRILSIRHSARRPLP